MNLTQEEIAEMLRAIAKEIETVDVSMEDVGYRIVQILMDAADVGDQVSVYPEFTEIFDLAADIELGKENCEDFEGKAEQLKVLIKNI